MVKGNGFKAAVFLGALAPMYAGVVAAQVPTVGDIQLGSYGTGTDTSGNATVNACAGAGTGWTCSVIAEGNGFQQVGLSHATYGNFIRTVVDDGTGNFTDETFVKQSLNVGGTGNTNSINENGIVGQQTINEVTGGTTFNTETVLGSGWGLAYTSANGVDINQTLEQQGLSTTTGDDFKTEFRFQNHLVNNGTTEAPNWEQDGFQMQIDQSAGLETGGGSATDVQVFTLRQVEGSYLASAGNATLPGSQSLGYTAGDNMKVVWVGQNVDLTTGTTGNTTPLGSMFGYQAYQKEDAAGGTTRISYFNLFDTGPFQDGSGTVYWDSNLNAFGSTPCTTDPSGATC